MIRLSAAELDEGRNVFAAATNKAILNDINELAAALSKEGSNNRFQSVIKNCQVFQTMYNDEFSASGKKLLADFNVVFEDSIKEANAEEDEIHPVNVAFQTANMSSSEVL